MPESPNRTALDPSAAELLALFAGPLASVRFPDVDHATLDELATGVERGHAEVEQARALLAAAEAAFDERKDELLRRVQRAKAYARVYAEGNPELQARLDAIVLPRPGTRPAADPRATPETAPKKRGRPRKIRDGGPLFEEAPQSSERAAAPADEDGKPAKSDGRAA
ncbi:MAG TPA: hypothetical protein VL400_11095 [Polyangiaceae bacterium]|jgi:hypothetical protein|nr:hypothetical protein [Polyangiaceae bacterium]